jgi:hypothetical protein
LLNIIRILLRNETSSNSIDRFPFFKAPALITDQTNVFFGRDNIDIQDAAEKNTKVFRC